MSSSGKPPFWKSKRLDEMSRAQWESLCDGCGRCCLHKLEDEENGRIYWTNLACKLLDGHSGKCGDYANRRRFVPDCVQLTPQNVAERAWLPPTCAYRLVHEGKDLMWWHPLVSGDPETVHAAGVSVRGRTIPETGIPDDAYERFIVQWPGRIPPRAKVKKENIPKIRKKSFTA
jgi:uncharacterized cysteine cluster protein YcgN (CxxCxxCC family)